MNIKFVPLAFTLSFSSCSKTDLKVGDAYIAKDDSVCLKEYFEAEKQFKQGKLYYCHSSGGFPKVYPKEVVQLYTDELGKLGIELRWEGASSCLNEENKIDYCACLYMKDRINEKYGMNVIDSIQAVVREKRKLIRI